MIYGFVQQSGGHVRLQSKAGQGTTVTIYLPRYLGMISSEKQSEPTISLTPATASAVVMVVDDEDAVRVLIVEVLTDLGYTIVEAADGPSGLHILESTGRIDLLLTDVGLPGGMNGRQLADVARQRRPSLKVLFITGYAEGMAIGKGQLDQGMQVMTKPFAVNTLVTRIKEMIGD